MAPTANGVPGPQDPGSFLNGAPNQGPPPSTLAAQLVGNISASSRSSRPDETAELKKLFGIIEKVKNQPDLLSTLEQRVEHNHMLIYVYARVVLEGLRWDDIFADKTQLREEALRAINFLKITIRETPDVLLLGSQDTLIFRGPEPLWLWILPKVLRMLGHSQCLALTAAIEDLLQQTFLVLCQTGSLWPLVPAFLQYMQTNFRAISEHYSEMKISVKSRYDAVVLQLPPDSFLESTAQADITSLRQQCTYRLSTASYALRHAGSLLKVMTTCIRVPRPARDLLSTSLEYIPWLLDSYFALYWVQEQWQTECPSTLRTLLLNTLQLIAEFQERADINVLLRQSAFSLLVQLSIEGAEHFDRLCSDGEGADACKQLLGSALLTIVKLSTIEKPLSKLVSSELLPRLETLSIQHELIIPETDLWRCFEMLQHAVSGSDLPTARFDDQILQSQFKTLALQPLANTPANPRTKRRKVEEKGPQNLTRVISAIYRLLGRNFTGDCTDLKGAIKDNFNSLGVSTQCQLLLLLGYVCCAADDTLTIRPSDSDQSPQLYCAYCSAEQATREVPNCIDSDIKSAVLDSFKTLVDTSSFNELRRPRVEAMVVLRRLVRHSNDSAFLDLEFSSAGIWCMRSLHSSFRELRIAASRTLPTFLQETTLGTTKTAVIRKNQEFALQGLRQISEQQLPHLTETCIEACSQLGRVVPDDHLNALLAKLVDYLGHADTTIPAVAFNEILNLARSRCVSPRQLFEPFWRNIAFSAVKDLATRPNTARLLAELLDMSLSDFLKLVQRDALPYLVLYKRRGVVQKIAEVRGEKDPWQPILDMNNLGPILALLLVQDVKNVENNAMDLLRHISAHFEGLSLGEIVRVEPVLICFELLKAAGDADESLKPHIRKALDLMVSVCGPANGRVKTGKDRPTGLFLEDQVLGLVSRLTDVFNQPSNLRSVVEDQKRSIRAMEEMIRIGKSYIRIARPQISACILSSMSNDELRASAFSCWSAMIFSLDDDDVEVLIETTFFIINHYWNSFDDPTRERCRGVIVFLLKQKRELLQALISKLPSLSHINSFSDIEAKLNELRTPVDSRTALSLLAERISHENSGVVLQALRELTSYLQRQQQQEYIQASAVSEQPDSVVPNLTRALLDCSSRYAMDQSEISRLCTQSLGLIGCLDPNRVETVRSERQIVVENNFETAEETTDFVLVLLEDVLVKSFISVTDTKLQGFLSYTMQELLDRCDVGTAIHMHGKPNSREKDIDRIYRKFRAMSEVAKEILTPFLTSRYRLQAMAQQQTEYPIFRPGKTYGVWMRNITLDLLRRPQTPFATLIFDPISRVIRLKDLSIAEFMFPFLVVHTVLGDESSEDVKEQVMWELQSVLKHEPPKDATYAEREDQKLFYEAVFRVLDYAMRWLHVKRSRTSPSAKDVMAMKKVQAILDAIPAELISQRAIDCKAYSRALFHLEQHIRQVEQRSTNEEERQRLLQRLQDIYAQIDEPDGLEGISAHLHVLDINQQILSHRKAGRWAAAQTWYEMKLAEQPENVDIQIELLTCLKESGQHDVLLNTVEGIERHTADSTINQIVPYAVEASWATGRWQTLQKFISKYQGDLTENFNVCISQALLHLQQGSTKAFVEDLAMMRDRISSSMTLTATSSLHACHEAMLKCHVLTDLELIAGVNNEHSQHPQEILKSLNRRLEIVGSYVNDKQYILSIRRAAMELAKFGDLDISSLWLSSAKLARKSNSMHQSFNAVLHAEQLGDDSATIENAKILWKEGNNRRAIQTLQSAIASNTFSLRSFASDGYSSEKNAEAQQNMNMARAQLLLAKWLDSAGQTHASALRQQYQNVPKNYGHWEKGHYYLGRHYKKVLESEKALKPDDQSDEYLTGETAKLVIENYIRSLNYGTKYLYQTLPRILTLWLELGAQVDKAPEGKVSLSRELHHRRKTQLQSLHTYLQKYVQRLPAYIFYTTLPQIVARIAHPNDSVFQLLEQIIIKVVEAHPRQALWSMFAIMTSRQPNSERRVRGQLMLQKLRSLGKSVESGSLDLNTLLRRGEKLAEQLLLACNNGDFQSNRTTAASMRRDLNFNHKCTPCPLVVPIEKCLTATLPTLTDKVKKHQAFSRDVITIESFLDEVLVLGSLAKPRRLTARGSDGNNYMLLIKPKDDLRTDQRLMEFNSLINRSLKRDAESSRRQLYIRTYAVTPLNEECGIIEWVDGLKTLRDILLVIYRSRGIVPNYGQLAQLMKDAMASEKNTKIFTEGVLGTFPAVLPQWFVSQFPNPSVWFAARLRYTRSCAVMSMVGTILGLGDRHGENVLLEEGNGGVFHVDFNCLFDKGLTFAQPERVPFRLTHNMVAAMGIHGAEGPFRKCSELTLGILRQQEETLMTILEAFIYDPTLDLQRDKRRKHEVVRLNPRSVVESINRKVRGLLPDESIPLGVEGQVEELIKQAVNPRNLAAMYIGWCPFL